MTQRRTRLIFRINWSNEQQTSRVAYENKNNTISYSYFLKFFSVIFQYQQVWYKVKCWWCDAKVKLTFALLLTIVETFDFNKISISCVQRKRNSIYTVFFLKISVYKSRKGKIIVFFFDKCGILKKKYVVTYCQY